jgi:ADP-ribose pyrophosphatase YjhB (NUDIX family)
MLLVDHRDAGLWLPTGGHVEPNEHPREAVRRELRRELGVSAPLAFERPVLLTITETVGHSVGHRDVCLWYAVALRRDTCVRFDVRKFCELHWFSARDLPMRRSDPHLARFVAKLQFERGLGARSRERRACVATGPSSSP